MNRRLLTAAAILSVLTSPVTMAQPVRAARTGESRTFDRVLLLEAQGETSAGVSLGDVDRDGDLDILLAKGRHWPLNNLVLRNDGKGRFSTEVVSGVPDRTYTAALADLDGDGDLDLVVSNDRPDRKLVYLNDGTGAFRVASTFGNPDWSTRYVTVADLNGDGRPDLIAANRGGDPAKPNPSYVCLNDGSGGFASCRALPTQSATIIVASDFDGDGRIDLFVPHRDGGQSLMFWNDGAGVFSAPPTKVGPTSSTIRAAAAADIDGDGATDLVIGDMKSGMFVYLNSGTRRFAEPVALGTPLPAISAIAIADLNGDGALDIVAGKDNAPGAIYFNQGAGKSLQFLAASWNDGRGVVYGLGIGDLDGDGWPDIAAARSDAPNGVWFNARKN